LTNYDKSEGGISHRDKLISQSWYEKNYETDDNGNKTLKDFKVYLKLKRDDNFNYYDNWAKSDDGKKFYVYAITKDMKYISQEFSIELGNEYGEYINLADDDYFAKNITTLDKGSVNLVLVDSILHSYSKVSGKSIKNFIKGSYSKKDRPFIFLNINELNEYQPNTLLDPNLDYHLDILYVNPKANKVFLSNYMNNKDYVIAQYESNSSKSGNIDTKDEFGINLILDSGSIIKNSNKSELTYNYKIKDLSNYKIEVQEHIDNQVLKFNLVDKAKHTISFNIDRYEDISTYNKTLYLSITNGIENFIECKTDKCISDEELRKLTFHLIITTNDELYPDRDYDTIIDSVDMFPDKTEYQFDSDRDGMPDKWEERYNLNPNDPTDASKDLNGNGKTNLEEFNDGANPEALIKPTNLTSTKISNTKVKVSWDSVPNAEGYMVYTSENNWENTLIGEKAEGNSKYKVENSSFIELETKTDKNLWVVVQAYKGDTYSPESDVLKLERQINTPSTPIIKKTGQTIAYAKYDDGYYEKGITPNYDKVDDLADDGILDRITGIVWKDDSDTNSSKKTWSEAKEYCDGLTGSWQLPTREELSGIVRYDRYNPSIDAIFAHTATECYWTRSVSNRDEKSVWSVDFSEGVESTKAKTDTCYVRCVAHEALVANAGADQIVKEKHNVHLVGSHNYNKDNISSYQWSENGKLLGKGETLTTNKLKGGVHTITLTVTDNNNHTASDTVDVTVTSNNSVVKKTGQNISYTKYDDGYYEKGIVLKYVEKNGAILDRATGLIWQDSNETNSTKRSWKEAKNYCATLKNGNWRLPTRQELSGLIRYDYYNPSIDKLFKHTKADAYWSLDTSKRDGTTAWSINFSEGTESRSAKNSLLYTRCVQSNFVPTANAGDDQFVEDGQSVTLSANQSPREELIKSYVWLEGDKELGEGAELTLDAEDIRDGEHNITLLITDQYGNEDRDSIMVTIVSNNKVLKKTSQDVSYVKYDDGYYEKGIALNYSKRGDNILDRTTGRLWQDDVDTNSSKKTWKEAKNYCASKEGHWRLPTRKELSNLIRYDYYNPSIDKIFKYTASDYYWTVDTSLRNRDDVWAISFSEGVESRVAKSSSYYTRCVQSTFVPTANAGADIFVEKGQPVILSASNSPRKDLIDSYLWESREEELGHEENKTLDNLLSGRQNIYLTITDKDGKTDTDDLWVTIVANGTIVKKTGQTQSYVAHDDGDYQKGKSISYSDHSDTVTDNTTGLEWKDDETTQTVKMTWEKANNYCSQGNNVWRLPTRRELSSLIDYSRYNPSIDESFDNTASECYWTIDTSKRDKTRVWIINFSEGVETTTSKSSSCFVRCLNAN